MCTQRENATVKIIDFGTAMELEPGEQVKRVQKTCPDSWNLNRFKIGAAI